MLVLQYVHCSISLISGCSCLSNVSCMRLKFKSRAYSDSPCTTKFSVKTTFKLSWHGRLIRIYHICKPTHRQQGSNETPYLKNSDRRSRMCVLLRTKYAQYIIVFMDGFPVVTPLLFVPPVSIGIAKLPLDWRWVNVAAVLKSLKVGQKNSNCR